MVLIVPNFRSFERNLRLIQLLNEAVGRMRLLDWQGIGWRSGAISHDSCL